MLRKNFNDSWRSNMYQKTQIAKAKSKDWFVSRKRDFYLKLEINHKKRKGYCIVLE